MKSICAALVFGVAALGAGRAQAVSQCDALGVTWDSLEKDMARQEAEIATDNSAARVTLFELRKLESLTAGQTTISLMADNHCRLPTAPLSSTKYLTDALKCRSEQVAGRSASPACDSRSWVADAPAGISGAQAPTMARSQPDILCALNNGLPPKRMTVAACADAGGVLAKQ